MSITKPEDLLFVEGANVDTEHPLGDLNRIDWSLPIMPLRTGNTDVKDEDGEYVPKKKILAGIDKAFLIEALNERNYARYPNWVIAKETFSRAIESDWLNRIVFENQFRDNSWVKVIDFTNVDLSESDSVFNNHFYVLGDIELPSSAFAYDGGLVLADMEAAFRDIGKLNYYKLLSPSQYYTTTKTIYQDYPIGTHHWDFAGGSNAYHYCANTNNFGGIGSPNGSGAMVLTSFDSALNTGAYAKSILFYIFKLSFEEKYLAPFAEDYVIKTFNMYVKVNVDASNNNKPSVSDFNNAIDRCLQHKGIEKKQARPVSDEEWVEDQEIHVNIVSSYAICELRDRTRWTLSE